MTGKSAIVFGGCGFIGSHLLRALKESGEYDQLVAADIRKPRFTTDGVSYVTCDVREPVALDCPQGEVEIYNLAAVHTTPGHEDWEYFFTNTLGAVNVCDFARRNGIDRIVFTSSISVYGPSEAPKDEDSVLEPESAYGRSKFGAEQIHRLWRAEKPDARKLVVVRPAVIYGYTESGNFTRLGGLLRKGRFVFPGRKDTIKASGYVEDLVASFRFALARPEKELTYNFCHPRAYTAEDICAAFSRVAGYPPATRVLPIGLMLGVGLAGEIAASVGMKTSINRARMHKLNRSTNIVPKRLVELGFPYRYDLDQSLARWREMSPSGHFD